MSGEEVTRNEFNGAIEGIRREIQSMGENLKAQLSQILRRLDASSEDSKKIATLEARVDAVDKRLDSAQNTARLLLVGLTLSLAGHLFNLLSKGVR
jgi:BMFP domain-containing protein YqiC